MKNVTLAYVGKGRQVALKQQQARIECTLDAYRFRSMITDEQHQAAVLFRWAYLTAARTIKVADPDWGRIDGGTAPSGDDRPTVARLRVRLPVAR